MAIITTRKGVKITVDDDDFEELSKKTWSANKNWYAVTSMGGKLVQMHRLVNKTPKGYDTDHINGDILDNRKSNLRSCTRQQNLCNKPKHRGTSRYKGVCRVAHHTKWKAAITHKNKVYHIGYFDDEVLAAKTYDKVASLFCGEFASLNFPDTVDLVTK